MLPDLGIREVWTVGLAVVLAVLRPVGRMGWVAASSLIVAGLATVADAHEVVVVGWSPAWTVVAVLAWLALGAVLAVTAVARPLRWEPRTGPSAATALLVGAGFVHLGAAWHGGGGLAGIADRWAAGQLNGGLPAGAGGPLAWPSAWVVSTLPGVDARVGAAVAVLAAAAIVVVGAERLGRRWGYGGTARCAAAAVAWAPPLLLGHRGAEVVVLATGALVWSWWALLEVWTGRYRPGRLAFASGSLLGAAVGLAVWPLVVIPVWVRRLGWRAAGWFAAGTGVSLLAAWLALRRTSVSVAELWHNTIVTPMGGRSAPGLVVLMVLVLVVVAVALRRPLTPTRLSAVTGGLLLATVGWWPAGAGMVGAVVAVPFVLLTAVAPDRPSERWPPDAVDRSSVAWQDLPLGSKPVR